MCLDYLHDHPYTGPKVGWKVFRLIEGRPFASDQHDMIGYPEGEWIEDRNDYTLSARYRTGFHIFTLREDAEKYKHNFEVIRQVQFGEVVAYGVQIIDSLSPISETRSNIVVARKMKILKHE